MSNKCSKHQWAKGQKFVVNTDTVDAARHCIGVHLSPGLPDRECSISVQHLGTPESIERATQVARSCAMAPVAGNALYAWLEVDEFLRAAEDMLPVIIAKRLHHARLLTLKALEIAKGEEKPETAEIKPFKLRDVKAAATPEPEKGPYA